MLVHFFKLIRWPNILIIAFTQVMARLFIVKDTHGLEHDSTFIHIVLATVFVAMGGYIINDYFDIKIDQVNKPNKVIIGKYIKRRNAIILHLVLTSLGLVAAFFAGFKILILSGFSAFLLLIYAFKFKKNALIGNFIVAFLTSATLLMLAMVYTNNQKLLSIFALFAFFSTLVREIIKDIEDIEGDRRYGCKTLPIIWGEEKTKSLLLLIIATFVVVVFFMGFAIGNKKLLAIFILLCLLLLALVVVLINAKERAHYKKISSYCKWFTVLGVLSMVVL